MFATVAEGTRADVMDAIAAARKAQPAWAAMSLAERSNIIMKLAAAVESKAEVCCLKKEREKIVDLEIY